MLVRNLQVEKVKERKKTRIEGGMLGYKAREGGETLQCLLACLRWIYARNLAADISHLQGAPRPNQD
jgi:hypothetical protein